MITEINIGGALRTLRFNNYSKEALGRLYGVDPVEATNHIAKSWADSLLNMACDVIYAGLIGDYRVRRAPVDFSIQTISEWVAEADNAELGKALNAWGETEEVRNLIKGLQPEKKSVPGKKLPGKKSRTSR